jgi:hypothetical protein
MSRPKTVRYDTFHLYDKLHTIKQKMMSGVEMTILYPIKETTQFYVSPEVWSSCASKFRMKKDKELKVDIPIVDNEKTVEFLEKNAWHDWAKKEHSSSETLEVINLLNNLFPDKECVYFYELHYLLNGYNWGYFSGEVFSDHIAEQRKYYTYKYNHWKGMDVPEIKKAYENYRSETDENKKQKRFHIWYDLMQDYAYKHFNLTDVFKDIGEHGVCYPVAFSHSTADWSKEKYGKLLGYAHAGEIYFVVTADKIFFDIERHY